jgi:hypothetical protein
LIGTSVRFDENSISKMRIWPVATFSAEEGEGTYVFARVCEGCDSGAGSCDQRLRQPKPKRTEKYKGKTLPWPWKDPDFDTPDTLPDFFTVKYVNS